MRDEPTGVYDPLLADQPGVKEAAEMARKLRSHLAEHDLEDLICYGIGVVERLPVHAIARRPE